MWLQWYTYCCQGNITVQTENSKATDGFNRSLVLKNNAQFTSFITKINNVLIGNEEDLDVMHYNALWCYNAYVQFYWIQ